MECALSLLKNKKYAHFLPMLFTLLNICFTIVLSITLVPNISKINDVGLIRMLTSQTDRCLFVEKHPAFQSEIFKSVRNENIICVQNNLLKMEDTTQSLRNFVKKFIPLLFMSQIEKKEMQLNKTFYEYKQTVNNIVNDKILFNDTNMVNLVEISDSLIKDTDDVNSSLVKLIENFVITVAILMSFIVICQVFYNINTIILKKKRRQQLEFITEYKALNQVCHEIRNSLLPFDVTINEISYHNQLDDKYVNALKYNMRHIKYILNRRLDYNKILQNEYKLNYSTVNLKDFVKSYIRSFEAYANELDKQVVFDIDKIDNLEISNAKIYAAAYIKKFFFGPAELKINSFKNFSKIELDKKAVINAEDNILIVNQKNIQSNINSNEIGNLLN